MPPTDIAARTPPAQPHDDRVTLPRRAGEAPPEAILGRREFALVPWIVASFTALALAASTWLRAGDGPVDWATIGGAIAVAVAAAGMVVLQDRPIGLRLRRAVWVYALGGALMFAAVAAAAINDRGTGSAAFAGAFPLAVYLGLVFPRHWRLPVLAALVAGTVGVQLANPATDPLDAAVTLMLVLAAWAAGVVSGLGHARTAAVARRLSSFDHDTRTLNRRGLLVQVERAVEPSDGPDGPIALLVLDLAPVASSDPADPTSLDEELLRWAGTTLPAVLRADAELGRIARAEFAVLLPHTPRQEAAVVAQRIRRLLGERLTVTVGAATSESRMVAPADLLRVAEAATKAAASDEDGYCALVAGTAVRTTGPRPAPARGDGAAPLSYAAIRPTGAVPVGRAPSQVMNRMVAIVMLVVAACGVPIIVRTMLGDGHDFFDETIRYLGLPWLLWVTGLAAASTRISTATPRQLRIAVLMNCMASVTIGLAVAALADGGLLSTIGAALFIKLVFDATVLPRSSSLLSLGSVLVAWLLVAVAGPAEMLWVAPFHLALFAGSYAIGRIGYRAHKQIAAHAKSLARTDDLTRLPDRAGFQRLSESAFYHSATETGSPFGVITVRLEALRTVNATLGHAAGDEALRAVAERLRARLAGSHAIGRTGSAEFAVAMPVAGSEAQRLAAALAAELAEITPVSAGYATCPEDGASVPALLGAAAERR